MSRILRALDSLAPGRALLVAAAFVLLDVAPVPVGSGSGCNNEERDPPPAPERELANLHIEGVGLDFELFLGASHQLTATAAWTDGRSFDVTSAARWTSSDPTVATVDGEGLVTAVGLGQAAITAAYDNLDETVGVTVTQSDLLGCNVEPPSAVLEVGESLQIGVVARRESGTTSAGLDLAALESSDPEVASVDRSGLVTAVGPGNAEILAHIEGVTCDALRLDVR